MKEKMDQDPAAYVRRLIANPYYCLRQVDPAFTKEHDPIVNEELWIKAAAQAIKDEGSESFLRELLENLKGNWI